MSLFVLKRASLALALLLACSAGAAEVRPGAGFGLGGFPGSPPMLLLSPRLDLQVEGGDGYVAFFAAARFGTYVPIGSPNPGGALAAPTVEAGARWHVSRKITLGLAIAAGVAVLLVQGGGTVFLVGATIEPFTWSFNKHHEVGLAITGLLPAGGQPGPAGPFFTVLLLPTAGYTFRF